MKKWAVGAVIVAGLALSGCSAAGGAETADAPATQSAETTAPAPTPTSEATGPAVTATPDTGGFGLGDYTPDEFFLEIMNQYWQGDRPSDQELFDLAGSACDSLRSGADKDSLVVVEGDARNNGELIKAAVQVYCPEFG